MDDVVLLHGFAGTGRSWDPVIAALGDTRYLAPDIHRMHPGGHVDATLQLAPDRFVAVGYSMGARVALQAALAAPERVSRLVLIGATPGIEDAHERAERRVADEHLAARIRAGGIEAFADMWMEQPIFVATPEAAKGAWREDLVRNDVDSLIWALESLGQGAVTPLWDRLPELTMPVDVVVGERDAKYRAIGERMADALPDARLHVIAEAGHGVPREQPEALARVILR